jgi:hypothetical protein
MALVGRGVGGEAKTAETVVGGVGCGQAHGGRGRGAEGLGNFGRELSRPPGTWLLALCCAVPAPVALGKKFLVARCVASASTLLCSLIYWKIIYLFERKIVALAGMKFSFLG